MSFQAEKEIELIANLTGMSKQEAQEVHQAFIQRFPDGHLNESDFATLYKELVGEEFDSPAKFAKFLAKAVDKDGNGKITLHEFFLAVGLLAENDKETEDQKKQRLDLVFDIFDTDRNGKISKSEFATVFASFIEVGTGKDFADSDESEALANLVTLRVFKKFDTGQKGWLNKEEFVHAYLRIQQQVDFE